MKYGVLALRKSVWRVGKVSNEAEIIMWIGYNIYSHWSYSSEVRGVASKDVWVTSMDAEDIITPFCILNMRKACMIKNKDEEWY